MVNEYALILWCRGLKNKKRYTWLHCSQEGIPYHKTISNMTDEIKVSHLHCWEQFIAVLIESQKSLCRDVVSVVRLFGSSFLVYIIKSTFLVEFSWNLHSLSISLIASNLLILKKIELSVREKQPFKVENLHFCGQIFVKLAPFVCLYQQ